MKYIYRLSIAIIIPFILTIRIYGQSGNIKGNIKDTEGKGIISAIVKIDNSNIGLYSGINGEFVFKNIPEGQQELTISLIGYRTIHTFVTVKANQTTELNITLMPDMKLLNAVEITGILNITGMGHMDEVHDGIIYSGKKNEVLIVDSMDANIAQNNPRQILGRIPGANFSETEESGFPANGIGFRGLNPTQSVETDTRQNGYNIAGDIYGYPESYYVPPLEAIERVEVTRGASSLQFGPQFGGVINYIIKQPPAYKPIEFTTEQTAGSFGLFNTFNSIGGTVNKISYYAFLQFEYNNGWRPNSQIEQASGFGRIEYKFNDKFKAGIEYSALRNRLHMPGGLDDATFAQDPQQSFRSRNWLTTPWNILALTSEYKANDNTIISFKSALNISQRNLVWRNEDGGPQSADSIIKSTGKYSPREVEHEGFKSSTSELRLLTTYIIHGIKQNLAAGIRVFNGNMIRDEDGPGSTGSDLNLNLYGGNYSKSLNFRTFNIAPFIENTFHLGDYVSVTPGLRFEYINSYARGIITTDNDSAVKVNSHKPRNIVLAGLGMQFKTTATTNIYTNLSQAYRPIEYSFLYPLGLGDDARIDPNLKDVKGFNFDFGWRGNIKNYLNFDIGGFYMVKNNEIALESLVDAAGNQYTYETNVADVVYKGAETYVELNLTKLFTNHSNVGYISFFNSFAYDYAKYTNGPYKGNYAEYAPAAIDRFGITWAIKGFSTTLLFSNVSKSYSDANNTVYSPDAEVGLIPAYNVLDCSLTYKIRNYKIKAGVNNLTNSKYFTLRTNEYPGPGIIPSIGRSFYVGFEGKF